MTAHYGNIDIVTACDIDAAQRDTAAALGIEVFDDFNEMLRKAPLDSLIIATPNHLHCEMTLQAFAAGLDVFVEKPLATTVTECDEMIAAGEAVGKFMMVGLCYRHSNLYQAFVNRIAAGSVGKPRMIWCKEFRGHWNPGHGDWRYSQAKSGGSLVEKNCHHFDIFNWAIQSRPVRVQAFGGHAVHDYCETIDHATVNIEYENGVKGTLMLSLFMPELDQLEIGVLGDAGKIETAQLHGRPAASGVDAPPQLLAQTLSIWPLPDGTETRQTVAPYYCPLWPDGKDQHLGSGRQFKVFNECLTQGRTPTIDGGIGRESVVIPFAAEESIANGGTLIELA
jgi:predicted dehydrogenase